MQQEQARRPPAATAKHAESRAAADTVATSDHTRAGDQAHPLGSRTMRQNDGRRHPTAAQNGTYACARVRQACLAWGGWGHTANRRSGHGGGDPLWIIGALSATPSAGSQQRKEDGEGAPQHCENLLWGNLGLGIVRQPFQLDVVLLCVANERIEQALA